MKNYFKRQEDNFFRIVSPSSSGVERSIDGETKKRNWKRVIVLLVFMTLIFSSGSLWAKTPKVFYLKPGKTVFQVRDEIRSWRKQSAENAKSSVNVEIKLGTYFFNAPVDLGPEDSNVTWQGEDGVVFTRGKKIGGWILNDRGWFETVIPEVARGDWHFEQLFVNGRRAVPARSPNEFYYYIEDQVDAIKDQKTGKFVFAGSRAFVPRESEISLFEKITENISPNKLEDVQIKFYHSWASSLHRLQSYDSKNKTVLLTGDARWNLTYWGRGGLRYQIFGTREALDQPGEFLLERNGKLTYIPQKGETLQNTSFIAPDGPFAFEDSGFFRISGDLEKIGADPSAKNYVNNIAFKKIIFLVDPFDLPDEGLSTGQAATRTPNSLLIEGARNILISDCEFRHLGGYAIWFHRACQGGLVARCLIQDVGAGGIKIGSADHSSSSGAADDVMTTKGVTVRNTLVRGYGQIEASAIGIWIGASADNNLVHNEVADGFYTGISVGWVWGYRPSKAVNNKIDFNRVHRIGKGVLSDTGAFYSLGISPGTAVRNNVMYDVRGYNRYGHGAAGLYTDEGSSNILFENNLIYDLDTAAVHQHYGENNTFRNNIFAFSKEAQLRRSRDEDHRSFSFENNIIVWDRDELLGRSWNRPSAYVMKNNLYWFCGEPQTEDQKNKKYFAGKTLAEWQRLGLDQGSVIADPEFADMTARDFHFKNDKMNKAVQSIGFKPFDFTKAGIEDEVKKIWGSKYTDYEMSEIIDAPDPPEPRPIVYKDSFDTPRQSPILRINLRTHTPVQQWKLKVTGITEPGGKETNAVCDANDLACQNSAWNELQWFGFCANGQTDAQIDLDNIHVRGTKKNGEPFSMEEGFVKPRTIQGINAVMTPKNDEIAWKILGEKDNRFLRIHDSDQFKPAYNPHFFYRFKDLVGPVTISFDMRISEDTNIYAEAREYASVGKYKSGPSLSVSNRKISAGGQELGTLVPAQWYHFELAFENGQGIEPAWQIVKNEENDPFLRISDHPEFKPSFEPHFSYSMAYLQGTVHFGFKCRFAKDQHFIVEGRNNENPYRIGPRLDFTNEKLTVSQKMAAVFKTNQWYSVEGKFDLGPGTSKEYTLSFFECDSRRQPVKEIFKDQKFKFVHNGFDRLNAFVVIGAGVKKTTVDMDDIYLYLEK